MTEIKPKSKVDLSYQAHLLSKLEEFYPLYVGHEIGLPTKESKMIISNMFFLHDLGHVKIQSTSIARDMYHDGYGKIRLRITAQGIISLDDLGIKG